MSATKITTASFVQYPQGVLNVLHSSHEINLEYISELFNLSGFQASIIFLQQIMLKKHLHFLQLNLYFVILS